MNSIKALFEVGEEVTLCSKTFPQLNCETVVIGVIECGGGVGNCSHCNKEVRLGGSGFGYFLEVKNIHEKFGCCAAWAESALRKKYKGSDFLFDEIIKEIKSGNTIKP